MRNFFIMKYDYRIESYVFEPIETINHVYIYTL